MMGQGGRRNIEFVLNLAHDHSVGMRREQHPQNPQARLRPKGREHVRIGRRPVGGWNNLGLYSLHISIMIEVYNCVKSPLRLGSNAPMMGKVAYFSRLRRWLTFGIVIALTTAAGWAQFPEIF